MQFRMRYTVRSQSGVWINGGSTVTNLRTGRRVGGFRHTRLSINRWVSIRNFICQPGRYRIRISGHVEGDWEYPWPRVGRVNESRTFVVRSPRRR